MENQNTYKTEKILEFAEKNGMLDLSTVLDEMNKQKRKEILGKHEFSIWLSTDGRWKTKVYDSSKDNGKRTIAKSKKEDLEDAIVAYYEKNEKEEYLKNITIHNLYSDWQDYKILNGCAESTIPRIDSDWKTYYLTSDIINIPIQDLDTHTIKLWILELIEKYKPTKTKYYNITSILRQMLEYAVERKIINISPMHNLKINTKKLLVKEKKKRSETQIFYQEEIRKINEWAMDDFHNSVKVYQLSPLSILFQFQTALRLGELCAIRYSDIETIEGKKFLHIQSMVRRDAHKVVEHTKTDAGDRYIPLTEDALHIISLAKQRQIELGVDSTGFIFSINGKPLTERSVADLYRKYSKWLGGAMRSSHDARKTVLSMLLDHGMSINAVREFAGHEDERTTLHNYGYTSTPSQQIAKNVNDTLRFSNCNPM